MSSLSSAFSKKRGSRLNSMNNLADNPGEEWRGERRERERHGRPAAAQSVAISGQSGEDSEMAMGSVGGLGSSCRLMLKRAKLGAQSLRTKE